QRVLAWCCASFLYMVWLLASAAITLYPMVLPATNPANSLTIYNASASQYAQAVGLVWWLIGMVLAILYFILTYRLFRGKVRVTETLGYYRDVGRLALPRRHVVNVPSRVEH